MASGSLGRGGNSGSKVLGFGSDDILCSYEDYGSNQDGNNGTHEDSSIRANSSKDFQKSRMKRTSVFPATTYSPPDVFSFNQNVILTVENTMKKYSDDLMRFLEGISSRLSQLELYCYNLDKSIGEMRSDLVRDHDESKTKLKYLEKHIQEVHRSVQILRDKQELADTQKELAKLQLAQKESSSASNSQENEGKASPPSSEAKKSESSCDVHGRQQLAFVPHQVVPQPAQAVEHQQPTIAVPSSIPSQTISQAPAFYFPSQLTNQPVLSQPPQNQYLVTQSQLQDFSRMALQPTQSQLQEFSRVAPQAQSQLNQSSQIQSLPPYQQPWPQQQQQLVQPSIQPVMHPTIRSPSPPIYSSYLPNQPNQSPAEMISSSIPMQVSFAVASQPGSVGPETIPYGYGAAGRPIQPHPSIQNLKVGFISQSGDGYVPSGPRPTLPPGNAYMMFDGEGGRMHNLPPQPHFHQGGYPPTSSSLNLLRVPSANTVVPQSTRSHPHSELIEKVVSMGYRGDHVVGIIQRMGESGQPIDFNSVIDRLNGHSSGGSQRTWSG